MLATLNLTQAGGTERERVVPLLASQRAFWLQSSWTPDAARAGNLAFTVKLSGPYDHAAMQRACEALIERHEALRTRFGTDGASQVVLPRASIEVELADLSGLPSPARESEAEARLGASAAEPFNLESETLLRAVVVRFAEQLHVLTLTTHHAVANGPSGAILLEDLSALYEGETGLPVPMQLSEFVGRYPAMVGAGDEAFWLGQFAEPPPPLELPLDRCRPSRRSFRGGQVVAELDDAICRTLQRGATSRGGSLSALLFGAFTVLLGRLSEQEDVVVGVTFESGIRRVPGGSALVANTTHVLPLRSRTRFNSPFSEHLKQTRKLLLTAGEHKEYFLGRTVEELIPGCAPAGRRLISVLFNFYRGAFYRKRGALEFEVVRGNFPYSAPPGTAMFDLDLDIIRGSGGLELRCAYAADLFEPETIARWLGHYRTLLLGIAADPDARLSELPLLSQAERQQILVDWNATDRQYATDAGLLQIVELVEVQVARTPEATALVQEGRSMSYAEMNRRANRLAHRLRELGVGPEVLAAVLTDRSMEAVIALLAILKAGGTYLPLDPGHPPERIAALLNDAQPALLLASDAPRLNLAQWNAKLVLLTDELEGESDANPASNSRADNAAYIIYTSGSSGSPKGVVNCHRGICNRTRWWRECLQLNPRDRLLQRSPLIFDVSLAEIFGSLTAGAALVIARPGSHGDVPYLIDLICEHGITVIDVVPPLLAAFLDDERAARCLSLRAVISGGEALPIEVCRRFWKQLPGVELHNAYGPTEAGIDVSHWKCCPDRPGQIVPIGRPLANTQFYVLDRRMQPTPVGVPGELCIGGVQVARGYLNRPELTAERFVPNPFGPERLYKTGDLCRYRPDGILEFLGRMDQQVKVRGFRIELGEIEAVIKRHASVRDCVALVRAESGFAHEQIVAYVVSGHDCGEDLRDHAARFLPNYMLPSSFVILDRLPLSANGKVNRGALPVPALGCKPRPGIGARNWAEARLLAIWREELRQPELGVTDDFFQSGGDSLLALKIFVQIEQKLKCRLPLSTLFAAPTVALLAQHIDARASRPPPDVLVPIRPVGTRPPFFAIHGGDGDVLFYRKLADLLGKDQPFYALQAAALDGGPAEPPSVEVMAARYVAEIRQVQPCGGYLLGGYSFGGLLAYEVARRLHLAGETVALLVMFDTSNPTHLRLRPFGVRVRNAFRGHSDLNLNRISQFIARRLPGAAGETVLRCNATLYRRLGWVLRQDRHIIDPVRWRVIAAHERAFCKYQPLPYAGKVHLIRVVDDGVDCRIAPDGGWSDLAVGGVEIHHVPGTHLELFSDQNVSLVAAQLRKWLEAISAEGNSIGGR